MPQLHGSDAFNRVRTEEAKGDNDGRDGGGGGMISWFGVRRLWWRVGWKDGDDVLGHVDDGEMG